MPFPDRPSRMPLRAVRARRGPAAVVAVTAAVVATTATLALAGAGPAGAAPRDPVRRAAVSADAVGSSGAVDTTAPSSPSTTTSTRVRPRWVTPVRRSVRTSTTDPAVAEVVRLVNVVRAKAGCGALRSDARLAKAARLHSEDMARQNYFSHTSLDGRSPWDRIEAQGYADGSAENIAAGYTTPAAVMDGWMNSPGHRANILDCKSKAIGVGIGRGGSYGTYWTQDFGRV